MDEVRRTETGYREEPPGREEAEALAAALALHAGLYVSFQEHDRLALNPDYGNAVTPRAVYGFPVEWILARARAHADARRPAETAFARIGFTQRANAFVFGVGGRVLDTLAYRGYVEDQARLAEAHAGRSSAIDDIVGAWTRNGQPRHGTQMDARRLFGLTEAVVDRLLGLSRADGPFRPHPDKPELWRRLFRDMGFSALVDRTSLMTGDYGEQVAVFDDAAIDLRCAFDNPCAAPAASTPRP